VVVNLSDELRMSGLTGRGGAAFASHVKVDGALSARADLIVNACDGELGARKDGWVVAHHLEELVRGARLVTPGRRQSVAFAAHRGSAAAARLRQAGLDLLEVPDRYVSSEETSLISLAHGRLARPLAKRDLFVRGGRDSEGRRVSPTVVLNAETVWRIAQVADLGADWFRSFGTAQEPGPRLATVAGYVGSPRVIETHAGVPLLSLIEQASAPPTLGPVLLNGLGGVFLSSDEAETVRWSKQGLAPYRGALGPGIIEVIDPRLCPLDVVRQFLVYAAGETAGQCGPCMFGVPATSAAWASLLHTPTQPRLDRLRAHLSLLPGRGACKFPDGIALFVDSALRVFGPHLREHVSGPCARQGGAQRVQAG
jgi:NADH:ubiquinone oxidoreductase subunit F (NADH-binding)